MAKLLGLGSKMLLTRLLLPDDIGLMVTVFGLTGLFEVLTEVGIKQSVIQNKDGAQAEYLNTAWWLQSVRGVGLYLAAYPLVPFLCNFYFQSKIEVLSRYPMADLVSLVRVAFLTVLLNGFISPRAYVLEKRFKFGKAALIMQGGFILGTLLTVILALVLRNVWAIAIGSAGTSFFRCVISYALCPYIPKLEYHRESFRELWRFARGMLGLPVLTYIAFSTDVLVIGKILVPSVVAFYGMARQLALSPRDLYMRIISPVMLSAFAEEQDNKEVLRGAIVKLTKSIGIVLFPWIALALVCGKTILALVYGSSAYATAALAFGILCVYVACLVEGGILASVFFGTGKPEQHRIFVALRAGILVVLIYPAAKLLGINGAALAMLLASATALIAQVFAVRRNVGLRVLDYLAAWLPGLILAIPVAPIVWLVGLLWPGAVVTSLVVGSVVCLLSSVVGLLVIAQLKRKAVLPGRGPQDDGTDASNAASNSAGTVSEA